jgi:hypothetical protein
LGVRGGRREHQCQRCQGKVRLTGTKHRRGNY